MQSKRKGRPAMRAAFPRGSTFRSAAGTGPAASDIFEVRRLFRDDGSGREPFALVVLGRFRSDVREARVPDLAEVLILEKRAGGAAGPGFHVALYRVGHGLRPDDVRHLQASAGAEHAEGFGEDHVPCPARG